MDVLQGGHRALGEDLALHLDRMRRQQPHVEVLLERPAVDFEIRQNRRRRPGQVDDRAAVGDVGHDLQGRPQTGEAGQGDAVQAELQDFGRVARIQHRHREVVQADRAVAGNRRALAGRVVAGQHEHAAVLAGADEVAVAEGVPGAVDAGGLAVPDAHHAVVALVGEPLEELGAVDRRRRRLLVDPRLEDHVVFGQQPAVPHELLVVFAEWRSGIAADERTDSQAGVAVPAVLVHRQPDQSLDTGYRHAAFSERVLVV